MTMINIGCGRDFRRGWLNIDGNYPYDIPEGISYCEWDLRFGLPEQAQNVSKVLSSHLIEHLTPEDNIKLFTSCYERMVEGGVIYLEIPDFVSTIKAYLNGDWEYFNHPAIMSFCKDKNLASLLDYALHQRVDGSPEHIAFVDASYAIYMLKQAGFNNPYQTSYWEGVANSDDLRRRYSIYVQAVK